MDAEMRRFSLVAHPHRIGGSTVGWLRLAVCALAVVAAGCATVPPDVRIAKADPAAGYRIKSRLERVVRHDPETLLILAFSGGGTRAAAFSYGVLEELRRTPVVIEGREARMLDQVDGISSVSGGSFTALAYALYGDQLFEVFEPRFLKRNVERALIGEVINPFNWPQMTFGGLTRSDIAARYYDQILFQGATFGDLVNKPGPLVVASSTEFASGYRFTFTQDTFDAICADLSATRLSIAATASSAVPVAFAPVTLTNWGGTCGPPPSWLRQAKVGSTAEALSLYQRFVSMRELADSKQRPWLHLVDGGVSDNLGLRAILDLMEVLELQDDLHKLLDLRKVRRVAVIVVNSASSPPSDWNLSPGGPNLIDTILQSSTVPIDHNTMDSVVMMELMIERWKLAEDVLTLERRTQSPTSSPRAQIEFYPIVLSFEDIADDAERKFFNSLPTTFDLPDETVDRLRAIGGTLLRASSQFQQFWRAVKGPAELQGTSREKSGG